MTVNDLKILLMDKYRIKKVTTISDNNDSNTLYFIQKKVLFWWTRASTKTCYQLQGANGMMLSRGLYNFGSIEKCRTHFNEYFKTKQKYTYKNNTIQKRKDKFDQGRLVYVNRSRTMGVYGKSSTTYEYDTSLKNLKYKINERITKKIESLISINE